MEAEMEMAKVFTEISEIFKYTSKDILDKIPKKLLETFEKKKDVNYKFKCDLSLGLENQLVMPETKDLIAMIYMNYCCSEEKKKELMIYINENERRIENNLNNIWNNKEKIQEEETTQELMLIEEENFLQKIVNKIKAIFRFRKRQRARKYIM